MMVASWFLFLQVLLGGQDAIDLLDSASYWRAQNITVSVATMTQVLTPQPPPAAADLQQWGSDLGNADAAARKAAFEHLRQAGKDALATLQPLTTAADPEVALSARNLVAAIQANPGVGDDVSRLLAIRELEKLKDPAALPVLEAYRQSKVPFEAEYAAHAVATISGKPLPVPPAAAPKSRLGELARCFPEGTNLVLQFAPVQFPPKPAEPGPPPPPADAGAAPPPASITSMALGAMQAGQSQALVPVLRETGNFRLEAALVGVTLAPNGPGQGAVILRGQFQAERLLAAIEKAATRPGGGGPQMTRTEIAGHVALVPATPGNGPTLVVLGPDTLLIGGGGRGEANPIADMVTDIFAANAAPHNADLLKLVAPLDRTAPLWGGLLVPARNPNQKLPPDLPELGDITSATVQGLPKDGALAIELRANGLTTEARAALAAKLNEKLAQNLEQWRNGPGKTFNVPGVADLLESLKVQQDGEQVLFTGRLSPELFKLGPALGMMMRMGSAAPPPRIQNNVQAERIRNNGQEGAPKPAGGK